MLSFLHSDSDDDGEDELEGDELEEDDSLLNLTLEYVHIEMIEEQIRKNRILDFMNDSDEASTKYAKEDSTCCGLSDDSCNGIILRASGETKFFKQN